MEERLAAFVIRPRGLALVDLKAVEPIREAIDTWRRGLGHTAESRAAGQTLREKLWLPLEAYLAGATTVLISPDGDLGKLPFASLPWKEPGSYLLGDYTLAVVPAARTIVGAPTRGDPSAICWFWGESITTAGRRRKVAKFPSAVCHHGPGRPRRRRPAFPAAGRHPGELATIEKLYRQTFGTGGLQSLEGAAATQAALVEHASGHLYLHLATHGYFAAPRFKSALDRSAQAEQAGGPFVSDQSLAGYHPGLLSGLALAGANQPTEEDDGILTAEEISFVNLSGCELVVLSACETGLGKAAGGEGLLGVQRAFQAAGARTVIASLWKVDDVATRSCLVVIGGKSFLSRRHRWRKPLLPKIVNRGDDVVPIAAKRDRPVIDVHQGWRRVLAHLVDFNAVFLEPAIAS